jgi:hypothetical protein
MNTSPQLTSTNAAVPSKEQSWREHAKRQKESGLSRKAYCCKYQLNYDHFGYWERKWREQMSSPELVPVHLNRLAKIIPESGTVICTLAFKNGHELKIHDKALFPMLLSLWG